MVAQGAYSVITPQILDNDGKNQKILALRTYWCNQYGTRAAKFGDPCHR